MRSISELIIHCSATPEGKDFTVRQIRQWHLARGFRDIGYHYVIYRDGSIHKGRPLEQAGAHCAGHNRHSIGICYIGGLAINGKTPQDTRTEAQKAALVTLLKELHAKFPHATLHGHREFVCKRKQSDASISCTECSREYAGCKFANKACPCFDVGEYAHIFKT